MSNKAVTLMVLTPLLSGWAAASLLMLLVWVIARRIGNNGIVDAAWSFTFTPLVLVYALAVEGDRARTVLLVGMVLAWSLRLTIYLYRRVMALHPVEDTRYQDLREAWAGNLQLRFFVFFQAQAAIAVFFSVPHLLAASHPAPLTTTDLVGAGVWAVGFIGEATADWQLARFKANPANKGRICDVGLWATSRHPNYFFEWLVWIGFALFAWSAPWGWLALSAPAAMLYLLLRVTGIPATEEAAVKRRGDAYREYQRTTSAFVPWFPSR